MKPKIRSLVPFVALLAVMAAAFFVNTPAFAQDELPPAEPPNTETPEFSFEEISAEEPNADISLPPPVDPLAPSSEEAPPVESPVELPESPAAETPTLAETVETLDQAGLTISDSSGEPLPLASESSLGILATNDVSIKLGGTTFFWTTADCNPFIAGNQVCVVNRLQDAVNYLSTNNLKPDDNRVVLADGTFNTPVTINGTLWTTKPSTLILIGAGSALTTVTSAVTVQNVGSFTLQGMTVNAGVTFTNNAGKITVKDVKVKNPAGNGINASGASTTAFEMTDSVASGSSQRGLFLDFSTGNTSVTILRSTFNQNSSGGILMTTLGSVTLNQVSAVSNTGTGDVSTGHGAFINGGSKPISVTTSEFSRNFRTGLIVQSTGPITVRNVSANRNLIYGAWIQHNGPGVGDFLIQSSEFNENNNGGLLSTGTGAITLNGVSANGNNTNAGAFGIRIDNTSGVKGVSILDTLGANSFNGNGSGGGLEVKTKGGITANGISAIGNTGRGALLENFTGNGKITLNRGTFIDNSSAGVELISARAISVRTITARGNTSYGTRLDNNSGPLNQSISVIQGVFTNNAGVGLQVNGRGSVLLDTIDASGNTGASGFGAIIDNTAGTAGVTVKASSGPNRFSDNNKTGLKVDSLGAISIVNASASGNLSGADGFLINNMGGSGGVTLKDLTANGNTNFGIAVSSKGAINASRLAASGNALDGANLSNNAGVDFNAPITVSQSVFNGNLGDYGLLVNSRGKITLNTISAIGNFRGIGVGNPGTKGGLSFTSTFGPSVISGNTDGGLVFASAGALLLRGLVVEDNGSTGISGFAEGNATLTDIQAHRNWFANVFIGARGNILLDRVHAHGAIDLADGISVNNAALMDAKRTTTIRRSSANNNEGIGIKVTSNYHIVLSGVQAHGNGEQGILAANGSGGNVTINTASGPNIVTDNTQEGALVDSGGSVAISGLTAQRNTLEGLEIITYTDQGNVTLTSLNLQYNANLGIRVTARGSIKLDRVTSDFNDGGALLDNTAAVTDQPISILRSTFNTNFFYGFTAQSKGNLLVNGVSATGSVLFGGELLNNAGTGTVTIASSYGPNRFNGNGTVGLSINSSGAVTISKLMASGNGLGISESGLNVTTSGQPVTITCGLFTGNGRNGIRANLGAGVLTLKGVTALGNDLGGSSPDPDIFSSTTPVILPGSCGSW